MKNSKLKHIAPTLYKLKKLGSGFTTPEAYFETIENSVFETINLKENLFDIPENYFESIEDRVFSELKKETKIIRLKNTIIRKWIPLTAAASLLLFVGLHYFNNTDTNYLEQIANTDIEYWIENGDFEINSYEIASLYESSDFEDLNLDTYFSNDEYLTDYLDQIDLETLMNK